MVRNINNTYKNAVVKLDGAIFENCEFINCKLVYSGEGPVSLIGCTFENPSWELAGAADNTVKFLQAIYHGLGPTGSKLVESIINQIREPRNSYKNEEV
jgi:uncharacterized protein YjbI with pentapeptide repeats